MNQTTGIPRGSASLTSASTRGTFSRLISLIIGVLFVFNGSFFVLATPVAAQPAAKTVQEHQSPLELPKLPPGELRTVTGQKTLVSVVGQSSLLLDPQSYDSHFEFDSEFADNALLGIFEMDANLEIGELKMSTTTRLEEEHFGFGDENLAEVITIDLPRINGRIEVNPVIPTSGKSLGDITIGIENPGSGSVEIRTIP